MPPVHVLLKPASGLCNLRCTYCFYHDIAENREIPSYGFMSERTMENVIQKALEYAEGECTIAYQGGEPTLAGLGFFEKSIEFQRKHNRKRLVIHNALQTNGYRLGADWAEFFRENRFLVGLSLDGRKDEHDAHRVDASGRGSFNEVMKTARLFDRHKVDYNILTVVNSATARRVESIYNHYKKCGFRYLQFIPCLDPLGEPFGTHKHSLTAQMYGRFLRGLFDLWHRDLLVGQAPSIRMIDNYIQMLMGYPPESCDMRGVCGVQNVVEADGSVYPCDFYMLDEYRLGNLNEQTFAQIDAKREEIGFIEASVSKPPECETCEYNALCRGGCRRHREPCEGGAFGKTYFCEAYKTFFPYAMERMMSVARAVRANRFG